MSRAGARIAFACAAVALVALAAQPQRPAPLALSAARGALRVTASPSGRAILVARNLRPGDRDWGAVTLAAGPSRVDHLELVSSSPRERRGRGGGSLAERLTLRIAVGAQTVLSGSLRSLAGCHDLGRLPAGARRTYRFEITFPSGRGDDAYAGSAATVDETWIAARSPTACTPPPPHIRLAGLPRRCTRGDVHLRVRIASASPITGARVQLGRWTLAAIAGRRRTLALRLRISDDWLTRRGKRLTVSAVNRAGATATRRVALRLCART